MTVQCNVKYKSLSTWLLTIFNKLIKNWKFYIFEGRYIANNDIKAKVIIK